MHRQDRDSDIADFLRRRGDVATPPDLLDEAIRQAAVTPQERRYLGLLRAAAVIATAGAAVGAVLIVLALLDRPTGPIGASPTATVATPSPVASPLSLSIEAGDLVEAAAPVEVVREPGRQREQVELEGPALVTEPPSEREDEVWIRAQLPGDELHPFAWLVFAGSASAEEALDVVAPRCPDESPVPVGVMADLAPTERLLCFGSELITVGGGTLTAGADDGGGLGGPAPWLIEHEGAQLGVYSTEADPSEYVDTLVGLRGHFDDPAAADCQRPAPAGAQIESPAEQRLWCRQRFVFEGAERLAP